MNNNSHILWLDDFRDPARHGYPGAVWVKNYDEAVHALHNQLFTWVSLDHDLGACADCESAGTHIGDMKTAETTFFNYCPHAKTGYDVICWMEANNRWPSRGVRLHTMNPVGRQRMQHVVLRHYGHLFD